MNATTLPAHTLTTPFHKLSVDEQRQQMVAAKAAVSLDMVESFLSEWAIQTLHYEGFGKRVTGWVVGDNLHFRVGKTLEIVSRDGFTSQSATPAELLELQDAIRSGQVQVELKPRWHSSVDSTKVLATLHQARGSFTPFKPLQ